jgi:DNA ligase-1
MITKPSLAVDFDETKMQFPYLAMPKIDGVRGIHLYGKPTISGRSLKLFGNTLLPSIFPNLEGFDGELVYGDWTSSSLCRNTTSVVNTYDDPRANSLVWYIFDYVTSTTENLPYESRYNLLKAKLESNPIPNVKLVPATLISTYDELAAFEAKCLSEGFEGVILRSPTALPKNGRTTVRENSYLRIKRFTQEDAVVVSLTEAMENTNEAKTNALGNTERSTHQENLLPKGMIGSLLCRDVKTGNEIEVGPGALTHSDRTCYWNNPDKLVGKTISYKHFQHGQLDKPRFPTYVAIREESDLVGE